jgi:cyclophilin family peptidyl-prolyl cis-trans isomerase
VTADDQASRDVNVRRAAARALARIASPGAHAGLLKALADEDSGVVAWAAFGLGTSCEVTRDDTVAALAVRSLGLLHGDGEPKPTALDDLALSEIARAVGRCAAETSEPTLFAWLSGSTTEARAATVGLGDLALAKKRLREETIASLLNLAAGTPSTASVPEAWVPLSLLDNAPPSVMMRLFEVGTERLHDKSDYRLFAIRALGRAKQPAILPLEKALDDAEGFSAEERVEAVRALAHMGDEGLASIATHVGKLDVDAQKIAGGGQAFDVPLTMILALKDEKDAKLVAAAQPGLMKIVALAPPDGATASGKRRLSMLRCAAARITAGTNIADPALLACDLDQGSIGSRALVAVVGKDDIIGARLVAYQKLVASTDVRTREDALKLLETHAEVPNAPGILTDALGAKEPGVVEAACDALAHAPARASSAPPKAPPPKDKGKSKDKAKDKDKDKPKGKPDAKPEPGEVPAEPDKAVVAAVAAVLERARKESDPELAASALDALGGIQAKGAVPELEGICNSPYPTLREHAAGALALITGKKHDCPSPETAGPSPPELATTPPDNVTLVFTTDAGELRIVLDGTLAPIAVQRFADLAKSGFYNGNVIHRVDPWYVVQFGSPYADGSGGPPDRLPLRCEDSPAPFERFSVGIATAGRDTGSSQLFVMRSRAPKLDGQYPIVGKASGPWDLVSEGDVIQSVRVE